MDTLTFYKYHGTGNDFVMIDARGLDSSSFQRDVIARLCHRRFGIGADGLILLKDNQTSDFEMVYFNSDGGESTLCGNGGRCVISLANRLGIIGRETRFKTCDGFHEGRISDDGMVSLKMNPVTEVNQYPPYYYVYTGSPHLVCFVEDVSQFSVVDQGKVLRHDQRFQPTGTNVNFVEESDTGLWIRTYEKGVEDETWSCGTGIVASVIAWMKKNQYVGHHEVNIYTKGGQLSVSLSAHDFEYENIWLKGPAAFVFEGSILV